jgi:hypothetical protein
VGRLALVVVLASGCRQLFGIEPVVEDARTHAGDASADAAAYLAAVAFA